jgi:hypothetical protein
MVGKIAYCVHTFANIQAVVTAMQSRLANPSRGDVKKAMRCIRWLNQNKHDGITFMGPANADKEGTLWATVDASFNTHSDGKGQTGFTISVGMWEPPLITCARKQKVMTRSSTDAEYVAYSDVCAKIAWFRQVVEFAGYKQKHAVVVENDNMSALEIGSREFPSKGVTHQSHRYHYFTAQVREGLVQFIYRETTELLADLQTKPLVGKTHDKHYDRVRNGIVKDERPEYPLQPRFVVKGNKNENLQLKRRE